MALYYDLPVFKDLARHIYRANKVRDKTTCLEQFLDSFELLKLELRLSKIILDNTAVLR